MLKITGIYLAAGNSRRMGVNKLNLPMKQGSLGSQAFKSAIESRLDHIFVITQDEPLLEWMPQIYYEHPFAARWARVTCADAPKGQAYSIRQGVLAAQAVSSDAVVILLADQPFVPAHLINALLSTFEQALFARQTINIVATSYQGIAGPPVLFSKNVFPLLLELEGDTGAKRLLGQVQGTTLFPCSHSEYSIDVDTKEDYEQVLEMSL